MGIRQICYPVADWFFVSEFCASSKHVFLMFSKCRFSDVVVTIVQPWAIVLSFMPDCCCCSYVLELIFSGFRFCKYHGCWRWICLWLQMGASWLLKVDFRMVVNWVHRQLLKMDLIMVANGCIAAAEDWSAYGTCWALVTRRMCSCNSGPGHKSLHMFLCSLGTIIRKIFLSFRWRISISRRSNFFHFWFDLILQILIIILFLSVLICLGHRAAAVTAIWNGAEGVHGMNQTGFLLSWNYRYPRTQ